MRLTVRGHAGAVLGEKVFKNTTLGAKLTRVIFGLAGATQAAAVTTWQFVVAEWALIAAWALIAVAIVGLAIGVYVLYKRWGVFHKAVNDLWRDILIFSPIIAAALTYAFGPIGILLTTLLLVIRYWKQLHQMSKPGNILGPATQEQRQHHGFAWNFVHAGWRWLKTGQAPYGNERRTAQGGNILSSGSVMVGERGPEILNLPRGASVEPLDNSKLHGSIEVHVHPQDIYMDGRKVGEAVYTRITDAQAHA